MKATYLTNYLATLTRDVKVDATFKPIDTPHLLQKKDANGKSILKSGSLAYVGMTIHGIYYLTDREDNQTSHAIISKSDFILENRELQFPKPVVMRNGRMSF